MRRAAGVGLCLLFACASESRDEWTGSNDSEVQSTGMARHFDVVTTDMVGPEAKAARATGALLIPRRSPNGDDSIVQAPDGTPIRSTCGVTFIDRTHAITAAHCADDIDVPNPRVRPLTVELYDIDKSLDWRKAAKVTGTYPAYAHASLAGQPGYKVTQIDCFIVSRCAFGQYECPEPAKSANADVMLLQCGELPADREPVRVAKADDLKGDVRAFWFHEVIDAPTSAPVAGSPDEDLFRHYAVADPTGAQNLHYFGGGRNDLLPLMSSNWRSRNRKRLGGSGNVVWTDLFGCHGTSGSGVMELDATTNEFVLLGPVATASNDWGHDLLCTNLSRHREGRANASYTALKFTQAVAAMLAQAPAAVQLESEPAPEQVAAEELGSGVESGGVTAK